ncbi:MAG: FAD-dependent oxidoreductase [Candidatus Thermoplasmatota archaeon]|nr:FAD-dependent oxidoreductase [Candidatus Thermoplasmatota archaeon]
MIKTDIVVIGGGPAGLAAAVKAAQKNTKVILLERGKELGGILPQCIHNGFGNFIFKKMLTGPEYAQYYIDEINRLDVEIKTDTMVLEITKDKSVIATNTKDGVFKLQAKAIVLAMGCRERTRSQILLPGTRPAGIFTAGTAQRLTNVDGITPGKKIVILGSGDVGLIMARRFTLEGAIVEGVYEIMSQPGGLTRNIVQCLEDYDIPLHLSHTVTNIHGGKRVEGVTVAKIDESMKPIKETERFVPCDCLILSVGLIPENELTKQIEAKMDSRTNGPIVDEQMQTSVHGIFACGNVVHVHDLVDDATVSAENAGKYAARYVKLGYKKNEKIQVTAGENVRYVVPQILRRETSDDVTLYFRVENQKEKVRIVVSDGGKLLFEKKERIVKPPEMVKVTISKDILKTVKEDLEVNARG